MHMVMLVAVRLMLVAVRKEVSFRLLQEAGFRLSAVPLLVLKARCVAGFQPGLPARSDSTYIAATSERSSVMMQHTPSSRLRTSSRRNLLCQSP